MAAPPMVGTIELYGFNFAPAGWAKCDGSLLPIDDFDVLYQLLGTRYGGDGKTTFGLPTIAPLGPNGPGYYILLIGAMPT